MAKWFNFLLMASAAGLLLACSEEPNTATRAKQGAPTPSTATPTPTATIPQTHATVSLLPLNPIAEDCLNAIVKGQPAQAEYRWTVNGEEVSEQKGNTLCDKDLKRGDQVEVLVVGTGTRAGVTIGNSLPRIAAVSITTEQILRRGDITVNATAEDADGDDVTLSYQWLINGDEDSFSTTETLSAERYARGDTIQVKITPHDEIKKGKTFFSKKLFISNAPPRITSKPPQQFKTSDFVYQLQAFDPDEQKLTYRLEEAPEGMIINETTGQINWPLSGVAVGTYPIKVVVVDVEGANASQLFSLTLGKTAEKP